MVTEGDEDVKECREGERENRCSERELLRLHRHLKETRGQRVEVLYEESL